MTFPETNIIKAYGWAQNSNYWWRSEVNSCYAANHYNCSSDNGYVPCSATIDPIEFANLVPNSTYIINFFETSGATPIVFSNPFLMTTPIFGINGVIKFPFTCSAPFADVAYVLTLFEIGSKTDGEFTSRGKSIDTIYVNQNPYCMSVRAITNYKNYHYYWDFGNGTNSSDSTPCVNYPIGSYQIKLCYLDSSGDTAGCMSQQLIVLDTAINNARVRQQTNQRVDTIAKTASINSVLIKNNIKVYPNPAQNTLYISNTNGTPIDSYHLFDLLGNEQNVLLNDNNSLNISLLAPSSYFLHVNCQGVETIFKIIKTD